MTTPWRRAAVSGASGSSSTVHSWVSTPVSRATSRASESPVRAPVCTGFTTTTGLLAVAASAAVATVFPTPVDVPVTTVITGRSPGVLLDHRDEHLDRARPVRLRDPRADRDAQPGHPVGHRRGPEAADLDALPE